MTDVVWSLFVKNDSQNIKRRLMVNSSALKQDTEMIVMYM